MARENEEKNIKRITFNAHVNIYWILIHTNQQLFLGSLTSSLAISRKIFT